ncbi:hypothetical protein AK830_g10978 [Neonectria ditissima]|uniref:Uncharacterized protein n=1 Tax=Neonectria ditissima TaxID=78410 RepID=A0A0P7ANJ5_9HYPO|nr:hypothetical protein AK830_g10978 [Neonectria ditissima]
MQDTRGDNEVQEAYENSLELAARLLLMLRIGKVNNQFLHRRCLLWEDGSLRDFVASYFAEAPKMNTHDVKLPKSFNGWSLESIGGIQITFTDNVTDHLLLTDDDSKVFVFSYVTFLEWHRLDGDRSLLPSGLAEETLRTLALLFPQSITNGLAHSGASRHSWFRRLCNQEDRTTDDRLGKCGNLHAEDRQIENFTFWRDRVNILKQAYEVTCLNSVQHTCAAAFDGRLDESSTVFRYYAGAADKTTGCIIETSPTKLAYALREPLEVCGQVIPSYVEMDPY